LKSPGLPRPLHALPAAISASAPPAPLLHALPVPVTPSRCSHHLRWQGVPRARRSRPP
jgi:hypothetical protein